MRSGNGSSFGSFEAIAPGEAYAHTFDNNGVYVYYCVFHPGMVGGIVVGDGSGPGSANGDGAAPAGVTRRTASDIAALSAPATAANSSGGRINNVWLAAIGAAAFAAVAATVVVAFGRVRSVRLRQTHS